MNPWAPLDVADPLKEETPSLTIGQINPQEEEELVSAIRDRAYDVIKRYRAEDVFTKMIPSNAEALIDYLIKEYRLVFSSNIAGRPSCNMDLIRIPLKKSQACAK